MKKLVLAAAVACTIFASCKKEAEAETKPKAEEKKAAAKKEFKMYEASEMAALMEQMYADNMNLKQRIAAGDTIGAFPQHFLNIHTSAMTDETDNDAFFKTEAAKFLAAQQLIYKDSVHAKEHFNDAVSSCVACHQQKCEGPIPRIKKLYIK